MLASSQAVSARWSGLGLAGQTDAEIVDFGAMARPFGSRACLPVRPFFVAVALLLAAALPGCGGGSGQNTASPTAWVSFPISSALLTDANVVPITVESGPGNNVNMPYVSVTVCSPNTSDCKTIDHVLLDTGSTGLRLFASQLNAAPALTLPPQTIHASTSISECAQFISMVAWGTVKLADIVMGGERAASVPIQLMDANLAALPRVCGSGPLISTAAGTGMLALPANGILGVGLFQNDGQIYFDCSLPSIACQLSPPKSKQVQNPVSLFPVNNNGVAIQLPALPSQGATRAQGYLMFGIGTQGNNQLDTANVVPVDPNSGYFTTLYHGVALRNSFIDSGSNGLFFNDPGLSTSSCRRPTAGFYCPASAQNLTASIALATSSVSVSFSLDNADALLGSGTNMALANLGGPTSDAFFDWGLPFFFGRTVYTAIEGKPVTQGAQSLLGPFYAFTN